eukprot:11165610-Lingulodinium_polyedra.AAC.1
MPSPNDPGNKPGGQEKKGKLAQYETAVSRGVYTAQQFSKARQYALPYGSAKAELCVNFVLLARIPGVLEDVGVFFMVCEPKRK